MTHQQDLPSPGFPELLVLNAQGWWKSTELMHCQISLLCWVLSILWPTTSQPALPAIATAHLPACNPPWLDWSSFIRGRRRWWQVKCHYLRQAGNTACAERFPWGSRHEVTGIFWIVTCSEKLLSRALPSPPAFAPASYLHTTYALIFKCVCYLNLCNTSQTFLYENCFVIHQPLSLDPHR